VSPKDEADEVLCAACGACFSATTSRGFLTKQVAICFDCAVRLGGAYDGVFERWATLPRTEALTDRGDEPTGRKGPQQR